MANGADVAEAEKLLDSLELDLQTYLAEVDQILDVLDRLPLFDGKPTPPPPEMHKPRGATNEAGFHDDSET